MSGPERFGFYEFFAGGGLARQGLGEKWRCLMANDVCEKKARAYRLNFGASPELAVKDVALLAPGDLPPRAIMSWASFPCQDLSLAGSRGGLSAGRSGTFWPYWRLMDALGKTGRPVPIVVLENVPGALTSHKGRDFRAILDALEASGHRFGAMVMDAVRFVPQSRPRLFIVAVRGGEIPAELLTGGPDGAWQPKALMEAHKNLPAKLKKKWIWWRLPSPGSPPQALADLIEEDPASVAWHAPAETSRILDLMSETNLRKVKEAQALGEKIVGTVYRRTRRDKEGRKVQRAEVRFDQISGCLRTPAGGSSRQMVLLVEGSRIRSRLLSSREAARLMGAPETYRLPENYNEAYHLMGDGLVVPVVSWLERHLLNPLAVSFAAQGLLEAA